MAPADLVERLRGQPTVLVRGEVFHARPLAVALLVWGTLAAARLSEGPMHPGLALVVMVAPCAWLPLCFKRKRHPAAGRTPQAAPGLPVVAARIAVLLLAFVSLRATWMWLTLRHD